MPFMTSAQWALTGTGAVFAMLAYLFIALRAIEEEGRDGRRRAGG